MYKFANPSDDSPEVTLINIVHNEKFTESECYEYALHIEEKCKVIIKEIVESKYPIPKLNDLGE